MQSVVSKKNAEHYHWGLNCDGWHLLKSDDLSVIEERMPPGTLEARHYHNKTQQVFYILSGIATFDIEGQELIVHAHESIHIPRRVIHQILNKQEEELCFIVISQPKSHGDRVEIVDYTDDLKEHIKTLNIEWLEKYFKVEPNDLIQLSNPKEEILDKGGFIYYARYNSEVVGTFSLMKVDAGVYELAKMAVTDRVQGLGIGNALMQHCISEAKRLRVEKLVLYSNKSLASAIHLYEKYGFNEIDMERGHYERANIKMEKIL